MNVIILIFFDSDSDSSEVLRASRYVVLKGLTAGGYNGLEGQLLNNYIDSEGGVRWNLKLDDGRGISVKASNLEVRMRIPNSHSKICIEFR